MFAELKEARSGLANALAEIKALKASSLKDINALKASLAVAYPAGECPAGEYVQVDKTCGKPASGAKCNAGSFFDAHASACRPHSVCKPPKTFALIAGTPTEDVHCTKTHPCQVAMKPTRRCAAVPLLYMLLFGSVRVRVRCSSAACAPQRPWPPCVPTRAPCATGVCRMARAKARATLIAPEAGDAAPACA